VCRLSKSEPLPEPWCRLPFWWIVIAKIHTSEEGDPRHRPPGNEEASTSSEAGTAAVAISDVGKRQWARSLAVDIREAVLARYRCRHQHLARLSKDIRVRCERSHRPADELG
jgi:hypothetical protein